MIAKVEAGQCKEAIQLVQGREDLATHRNWYFLLADAQTDCFRRTNDQSYKVGALHTLNTAVSRFPESARPLAWRGFFGELLGEPDLSKRSYQAARRLATDRIRALPDDSHDERDLLRELDASNRGHP